MRTQILINNTPVDLLKDVSLNITKQLIDIQSPEKRKTDRTLTIEIPGSKNNDALFNYIFEVNIDLDADDSGQEKPHFNPNKKAQTTIFIDNFQQLKGYCQLTDIEITQRDKIIYKIVCYGEIGDLFSKIDNQKDEEGKPIKAELTDLDFSEFDHVYHRGNIANSWDTEIVKDGGSIPFELGVGYVYPMVDYGFAKNYNTNASGVSAEVWGVEQFRPAIYTKQFLDKIFEAVGYTYTSNFFNSEFFKRLIIPFNSDEFLLDAEEVSNRLFYAGTTNVLTTDFLPNPASLSGISPIIFDNDSTLGYFDNTAQYNTTKGIFTCNKAGKYKFSAVIDCHVKNTSASTYNYLYNLFNIKLAIIHRVGAVDNYLCSNSAYPQFSSGGGSVTVNPDDISSQVFVQLESPEIALKVGEQIFVAPIDFEKYAVGIYGFHFKPVTNAGYKLIINNSDKTFFANAVSNAHISEGEVVPLSSCVPTEVKQRDFLGSIIKAFNLYVEPNPDKENDLIIEPRAHYYTGQSTEWTHKLDTSKEFTISPMAALDAGEFHFTYKEDGDFLNKNYKNQYERIYGDYKTKIDNDFVKSTKKIELIFAPTPLFKAKDDASTRILPYIAFVDDKNNTVSTKTSKIRLLYYGGMKDCDPWLFDASGFPAYDFTAYPYSGHLDDPYISSFDLGFAPPFQVYYQANASLPINYTNQNLFTKYWYAQIKEITDKNSKLVEGWFYLTPADIASLSFRKYYFIKDAYYRLLKVENYDPVFSKVTKCQFLKVQQFDAPLQIRGGLNGGRGKFGATGTIYKIPTIAGDNAPIGTPSSGPRVVTGWDNRVAGTASSVLLTGVANNVLGGSERIAIIGGGDNIIGAGLTDVTLINTSGVTIAEPNVLYINNQKFYTVLMGDAQTIVADDSPYSLTISTRTLFCDATDGAITINLPTVENNNGKIFEILKTDSSSNTITINGYDPDTINGVATESLTTQYQKLCIVCNGVAWYKL